MALHLADDDSRVITRLEIILQLLMKELGHDWKQKKGMSTRNVVFVAAAMGLLVVIGGLA